VITWPTCAFRVRLGYLIITLCLIRTVYQKCRVVWSASTVYISGGFVMTADRSNIDKIKDRLDIVDLIGETIDLTAHGNGEYTGAINSGSKSGKSLNINKNIQLWNDWASGIGGDVYDWIAYNKNLDVKKDFKQILKIAAEMAGVTLENETYDTEAYEIYSFLAAAAGYYHTQLTEDMRYEITKTWGISNETIDQLKIGFAPVDGKSLQSAMDGIFHRDIIEKSGLVIKTTNGWFDFYQGRYIFPYWKNGKVEYTIARKIDGITPDKPYELGKYKKHILYKQNNEDGRGREYISQSVKNDVFYGENSLRGAKNCIITEGVTDCIMAIQEGFPCVSPVTVQFKKSDYDKIYSLVKGLETVYICNDNDESGAGSKGALATVDYLVGRGIDVCMVELPKPTGTEKIDLADFLKDNSADDLRDLMVQTETLEGDFVYDIPEGYIHSDNGMFLQKFDKEGTETCTPISSSKIWIKERIKNISDDTTLLKICFEDDINGLVSCEIPQVDAFQKRGVLELVNKGALFEESTTKNICMYLKSFLVNNMSVIKTTHAFPQLGWYDQKFVYGDHIIEQNITGKITYKPVTLLNGDENVMSALDTSQCKNAKKWVKTSEQLLTYPRARFMCYVSVVAPLLKKLGAKSFVVHQWGETSTGKSTLVNFALSIWGDILKLSNSGNVTVNYAEEFSQFCKDLPVAFDETQMSKKEDIIKIIYMLANETGKGRAKATGGTRTTRKWKVVGLTSGEDSVTSDTTFAGADVRVIQLFNGLDANDDKSEKIVKSFERNIIGCDGSIGPYIIKDIILNLDEWIKTYTKLKIKFNDLSKEVHLGADMKNVGGRLSDTFAVICTAGYLFESVLHEIDSNYSPVDPGEVCVSIMRDMLEMMSDKGYGQKAWDSFISWVHEKEKYFYADGMEISQKTFDYYGDIHINHIDILPTVFNKYFCEVEGFEKERVLKDWNRFGWIETSKNRNTTTARLKGSKNPIRVIRIKYSLSGGV